MRRTIWRFYETCNILTTSSFRHELQITQTCKPLTRMSQSIIFLQQIFSMSFCDICMLCSRTPKHKNLNLMYSFELSIHQNDRCKGQWKRIRRKYNIWADETQNYTNFLPPSFNLPFYSSFIVLLEHLWNYRDKALNNATK